MTCGRDGWRPRRLAERGAVTAEFAVTLPAVLLLLAMLLSGAAAGVTQLRLEEGARAGARALARGDDSAAVERIVRTLSGTSASAAVAADGEWLSITVTDRVGGPLGSSIPWTLTARASTRSETAAASPAIPAAAASPAIPAAAGTWAMPRVVAAAGTG
ncbi:MAG: TadE family protein [Pseudarthrobacter sp.]|nr:TadE family protein [Pseudarthrobacter sp.]